METPMYAESKMLTASYLAKVAAAGECPQAPSVESPSPDPDLFFSDDVYRKKWRKFGISNDLTMKHGENNWNMSVQSSNIFNCIQALGLTYFQIEILPANIGILSTNLVTLPTHII
jgi:hypothetical protein